MLCVAAAGAQLGRWVSKPIRQRGFEGRDRSQPASSGTDFFATHFFQRDRMGRDALRAHCGRCIVSVEVMTHPASA